LEDLSRAGPTSADIDSDLITFRIRLVNLICKHLVTLLHQELKYQFIKVVMSPLFASNEFSTGVAYVETNAEA
ncbi:hypothetical protein Tco_1463157, partial [Tanacetum coccineum]